MVAQDQDSNVVYLYDWVVVVCMYHTYTQSVILAQEGPRLGGSVSDLTFYHDTCKTP